MRLRTIDEATDAIETAWTDGEVRERFAAAEAAGFDRRRLESMVARLAKPAAAINHPDWRPLVTAMEDPVWAGRLAMLAAARAQLPALSAAHLDAEIRGLLADEFLFTATPKKRYHYILTPGKAAFRSHARLLHLRRLPAGQLHFEVSGFPRRWLLRVPPPDWPRLTRTLIRMSGFKPVYETHLATRWTVPFVLLPEEDARANLRIAAQMALTRNIRGWMSASWLNDPGLAAVDPSLLWRHDKRDHGAIVVTTGRAEDVEGGKGSDIRAAALADGRWRPLDAVMLWPRVDMIRWARAR